MRKVLLLFVFILPFFLAHSQYSVNSFDLKAGSEYEELTILTDYILLSEQGSVDYPLPVIDFLNCNDLFGVKQLKLHTMEGELVYRSYDPTENINLKNIPAALYMLSIYFQDGSSRNVYLQRITLGRR